MKTRSSNVLPSITDYFTISFLLDFLNFHNVFLNNMFSISWHVEKKQDWIKLKCNICLCYGTLGETLVKDGCINDCHEMRSYLRFSLLQTWLCSISEGNRSWMNHEMTLAQCASEMVPMDASSYPEPQSPSDCSIRSFAVKMLFLNALTMISTNEWWR